jgi:hypothetical protein
MATGSSQRAVLVFGKSQYVLDKTKIALDEAGYDALVSNKFMGDITRMFNAEKLELVLFGTQVPPYRVAEIKAEMAAVNPGLIFVPGLVGIPGLIVDQVDGEFADGKRDPAHAPAYARARHSILLPLADPAGVKVTAWWRTPALAPFLESDSRVLFDGQLAAGDHEVKVPERVVPRHKAWASVHVDEAIYAFSVERA